MPAAHLRPGDRHGGFGLWAHNTYAQAVAEIQNLVNTYAVTADQQSQLAACQPLIAFLADTSRVRVMSWEAFNQELVQILKQSHLMSPDKDYALRGAQSVAAQAVRNAALNGVPVTNPAVLPNPYARGSKYFDTFATETLSDRAAPGVRTSYEQIWDLIVDAYTRDGPGAAGYHLERLVSNLPGAEHGSRYPGLNWQLERTRYYFAQRRLQEVEAPLNGGEVDIVLTDGTLVDPKVLNQATWDGWAKMPGQQVGKTRQDDYIDEQVDQIRRYLGGNQKTLIIEYKGGAGQIDINVIMALVKARLAQDVFNRVTYVNP